jgi:hypothetical protein
MIKQSWNIDTEEVKRILMMHESATKNHYLINEQIKKTQTIEPKTFELPSQTFASGFHSENALSPSQKTQITNVLTQIAAYLKQYKGIPMEIQLTTGESKPTNYDKENKKSLGTGELANLRGETITRILTDFFNGLVQKGELPSMPKIPDEQKPAIGKVIAPAALFWFRYAALATVVTGALVAWMNGYIGPALALTPPFLAIGIGMWIALVMAFNVWFIIWPNQQKALGMVEVTPEAKVAAAKLAMQTSRINTMLSIPMLFMMVAQQNGGL